MAKGMKTKILVVGCKGVGKGNFIGQITGSQMSLSNRSHREPLGSYSVKFDEKRPLDGAIFEAIPFDAEQSRISPADVLYELAEDLKHSYKEKTRIPGVVLVHHVTDETPDQRTLDAWQLLFDILGEAYMPHLTIVTTKWREVGLEVAEQRERQLIEHWMPFLKHGARLRRFHGDMNFESREEAVSVVQDILPLEPILPHLTQELCVWKRKLGDTTAGARTAERMRLDLAAEQKRKARLVRAAEQARLRGWDDVHTAKKVEIVHIERWLAKLSRGIDCLGGQQRFHEPWYKRGSGVEGSVLGTAWSLF